MNPTAHVGQPAPDFTAPAGFPSEATGGSLSFFGIQGDHPTQVRQESAKYLKIKGAAGSKNHYDYLLWGYLLQEDSPLFVTAPSLIQHIGRNTTGLCGWREVLGFTEDVTQEPIGQKLPPCA